MSVAQLPPPASEAVYGYVVGRVIHRVADTPDDDDKPDVMPGQGEIVFRPGRRLALTSNYSAFLINEDIFCPLDAAGHLVRRKPAQGETLEPGVWLAVGAYQVEFRLSSGTIPAFTVEVTAAHTPATPLDLVAAAGYVPPPGVTVQTLLVPATIPTGWILTKAAGPEVTGVDPAPILAAQQHAADAMLARDQLLAVWGDTATLLDHILNGSAP